MYFRVNEKWHIFLDPRTPKEIMEILQIYVTRPGLAKPGPAKLEQAKPVPANPAAPKAWTCQL
jgi:hypothetical protein